MISPAITAAANRAREIRTERTREMGQHLARRWRADEDLTVSDLARRNGITLRRALYALRKYGGIPWTEVQTRGRRLSSSKQGCV